MTKFQQESVVTSRNALFILNQTCTSTNEFSSQSLVALLQIKPEPYQPRKAIKKHKYQGINQTIKTTRPAQLIANINYSLTSKFKREKK